MGASPMSRPALYVDGSHRIHVTVSNSVAQQMGKAKKSPSELVNEALKTVLYRATWKLDLIEERLDLIQDRRVVGAIAQAINDKLQLQSGELHRLKQTLANLARSLHGEIRHTNDPTYRRKLFALLRRVKKGQGAADALNGGEP